MNYNAHLYPDRKRLNLVASALLAAGMLLPASLPAATTITDSGASASVDFNSSAGMYNWVVDGQNQLNQQWFWYRLGASGVAAPINTISAANITLNSANSVTAVYQNSLFTLQIDYTLFGGGPGSGFADIMESISVTKNVNDANPLDFHLFQYSDFNLLNTPAGDTVSLSGTGGGFDNAVQVKGATQIAETITSPEANHGEAGLTSDSPNTLYRLNNVSGLTLNDNDYAGPGDATWALQWDTTVNYGMPFFVFKDKSLSIQVIPEPGVLSLATLGLGAWALARRRHSA
jgi:hypothetical protein